MKRFLPILGALALLAVSCQSAPKLTVVLDGQGSQPQVVVAEYPAAVAASSLTPGTFVIPGKEIAFAFVTDKNPLEKPEKPEEGECPDGAPCPKVGEGPEGAPAPCDSTDCCEGKPEGAPAMHHHGHDHGMLIPESKDGKYVVLVLKGAMERHGGMRPGEMGRPHGPEGGMVPPPDGQRPEMDGKAPQPDSAAVVPPKEHGDRPAPGPDKKHGRHEGKPVLKGGPVDITVQQVAPLTTVSGKTVKAWKSAVKVENYAKIDMPFGPKGPMGGHHGGPKGGPGEPHEPGAPAE